MFVASAACCSPCLPCLSRAQSRQRVSKGPCPRSACGGPLPLFQTRAIPANSPTIKTQQFTALSRSPLDTAWYNADAAAWSNCKLYGGVRVYPEPVEGRPANMLALRSPPQVYAPLEGERSRVILGDLSPIALARGEAKDLALRCLGSVCLGPKGRHPGPQGLRAAEAPS
jgi:hypothetical protein